jgi:hypothetical protein
MNTGTNDGILTDDVDVGERLMNRVKGEPEGRKLIPRFVLGENCLHHRREEAGRWCRAFLFVGNTGGTFLPGTSTPPVPQLHPLCICTNYGITSFLM